MYRVLLPVDDHSVVVNSSTDWRSFKVLWGPGESGRSGWCEERQSKAGLDALGPFDRQLILGCLESFKQNSFTFIQSRPANNNSGTGPTRGNVGSRGQSQDYCIPP